MRTFLRRVGFATIVLAMSCGGAGNGPVEPGSDLIEQGAPSVLGAGFDDLGSDAILRVATTYPATSASPAESPVSLTSSDGSGLELVSYDARAVVDGPLAFTEIHLTFRNPEPRTIEGRFAIALPASASISRLSMKNDNGWQEAEVVERTLARRAYEDFLHRKQDPALLEKEAGNEFRARIFPIAANGTKEIIVSYSEEIASSEAPYKLGLAGLPSIRDGRVVVFGGRGGPVKRAWSGSRPEGDVVVPIDATASALASDRIVVARVAPKLAAVPERIESISVLFDTSASRALGFKGEVDRLGGVLAGLRRLHGESVRVRLAVFDQVVTEIFDGPIAQLGPKHLQRVLSRRPLGASDLGRALDWLGAGAPTARAVLVTDGIPTLGSVEPAALRAKVAALRGKVRRIDAIAVGGIRDGSLLGEIVRGNLDADGVVADGGIGPEHVLEKLGKTTVSGVKIAVPGATWSWPAVLDGVQPGDEALVFAVFSEPRAQGAPASIEISGKVSEVVRVTPRRAEGPLIERAAVRAEIERLSQMRSRLKETDTAGRDKLAKTIVERSVKYRVLSDLTALLVLESDGDYERYGIDRKALAGILTVGDDGRVTAPPRSLAQLLAAETEKPLPVTKPEPPKDPPSPRQSTPPRAPPKGAPASAGAPVRRVLQEEAKPQKSADQERDRKEDKKSEAAPEMRKEMTSLDPGAGKDARPSATAAASAGPARRPPAPPPPPPSPMEAPAAQAPPAGPRPSSPRAAPPPDSDRDGIVDLLDADASNASEDDEPAQSGPPPYAGRLAVIMDLLAKKKTEAGLVEAIQWQNESPGDVMALVGLGEALEASGRKELAARAYGSIIDLFPARADLRRYAGMRIERLGDAFAPLAVDTYGKALEERPDHLTAYRSYAFSLVRAGRLEEAAGVLVRGIHHDYPAGRFSSGERILREDLGLVAASWVRRDPDRRAAIQSLLDKENVPMPTKPSLRFVLQWETDANDVDFHIHDGKKGHAFFSHRDLPSGGSLYDDVTTGYGPECFTIEGTPLAYPYRLRIHYYSRGPMGFGMGRLEIVRHDGAGNLAFEERPFVVMNDGAYVNLGKVGPETAKIGPPLAKAR